MNKKLIYILIVSICVSLLGMIVVQFLWIRNAFHIKEEMFDRSVNEALTSVVDKIETHENMYFISRNFEGDSILQIVKAFSKDTTKNLKHRFDSLMAVSDLPQYKKKTQHPEQSGQPVVIRADGSILSYTYQYEGYPFDQKVDSLAINLDAVYNSLPLMELNGIRFSYDEQNTLIDSMMEKEFWQDNKIREFHSEHADRITGMKKVSRDENIHKLEKKAKKIEDVIKQMAVALETQQAPVQHRINKSTLESTLSKSLVDKGIDLPFEFAVYSMSCDSNRIPIKSIGFLPEYNSTQYRVSLFPNDLFHKPDLLLLHFDGQRAHVFKSMLMLLVGSFLFTLIIVISSAASIVVMIRQKKISDIKTDFINNMTHEFKTPIATISIAADSINNPRVLTEPDKIKNFTRIIKEENNRMNTRVEQVLQMALLDSRDFRLRPTLLNLNQVIEKVVDHYRLQIQKREGAINLGLEAFNTEVLADEDHIRNVLLNLLDNANKYSLGHPDITVFSFNRSGKYCFGVQDKGMGMTQEVQRRVFDKFFRVTSGNIHNIKGFGLGLSYVKAIVLAHHGDIIIESEPGQGSRFEISLPLVNRTIEP